ncbi:MAG: DUF123 domain-containing protein, partial [Spirochaetales bacterium]
ERLVQHQVMVCARDVDPESRRTDRLAGLRSLVGRDDAEFAAEERERDLDRVDAHEATWRQEDVGVKAPGEAPLDFAQGRQCYVVKHVREADRLVRQSPEVADGLLGCSVRLERAKAPVAGAPQTRRTAYTAAAVIHGEAVVSLIPVRANLVVQRLVLPLLYPEATEVIPEYRIGAHRVDFLVRREPRPVLVEVKSCSLVEHGVAMFPDAPSLRATRHVRSLAAAAAAGTHDARVILVATHGGPRVLVPNLHTDPELATAFSANADLVDLRAVEVSVTRNGGCRVVNPSLPVSLEPTELVVADTGAYLLVVHVENPLTLSYGASGRAELAVGYYVYVGSAMGNLSHRVARHKRRRKTKKWHIDYLLEKAPLADAIVIYARRNIEVDLVTDLRPLAADAVRGFGASDSPHASHLLYFPRDPRGDRAFNDLVIRYRHSVIF